jgi:hypothetical protein
MDMQGLQDSTRASVNVVPSSALQPLQPIREQRSASLADKVALRTSDYAVEEIAEEIAEVISAA